MKNLTVSFAILGLGIIAYPATCNAKIGFTPKQSLKTQVQVEFISLFTQVNTEPDLAATSEWKEFYSVRGNFSVFVPDTSVINFTSKSEDYSITVYYADTKQSSYIIGYVDYQMDLSQSSLRQIYDKFLKEFLGTDVKLLNQQNITLNKYSGIEIEYQSKNQEKIAKSRFFLVGQRLYFLDISNYKAGDATQFFNSFQLENNRKANLTEIAINK